VELSWGGFKYEYGKDGSRKTWIGCSISFRRKDLGIGGSG
jgi:hypothetical protein